MTLEEAHHVLESVSRRVHQVWTETDAISGLRPSHYDFALNLAFVDIAISHEHLRPKDWGFRDEKRFVEIVQSTSMAIQLLFSDSEVERILDPTRGPNDEDVLRIFIERRRIVRWFRELQDMVPDDPVPQ